MDAQELPGVQPGLQAGQGLLLQVLPSAGLEQHIVVLGLDVVDAGQGDHGHPGAVLDQQPFLEPPLPGGGRQGRRIRPSRGSAAAELGLGQGRLEALGAERLEQVVRRVHLEGAQGVPVVGGDEHHGRARIQQLQHLEAVQPGHLDIQEQQVRRLLRGRPDGLEAIPAGGQHLDLRMAGQVLQEQGAGQVLVVRQQGGEPAARRGCGRGFSHGRIPGRSGAPGSGRPRGRR